MATKVNRADVAVEENDHLQVWRHIRRDGPVDVGVGIVAYKPLGPGGEPAPLESHDVPEVHYVLSGTGILLEDGKRIELRSGDAVVTPAGASHTWWSTSSEPLVMLYVAVGRNAR